MDNNLVSVKAEYSNSMECDYDTQFIFYNIVLSNFHYNEYFPVTSNIIKHGVFVNDTDPNRVLFIRETIFNVRNHLYLYVKFDIPLTCHPNPYKWAAKRKYATINTNSNIPYSTYC
jgi:hypothetical protein